MNKQRYLALAVATLPTLLMIGCASNGPSEKNFLTTAQNQLSPREAMACLTVQGPADYTSSRGPLPDGWQATLASGQGEAHRSGVEVKLNALVAAGLAQKEPYQLYKQGERVPGFRYSLTQKGRKALTASEQGPCLQIGRWEAKRLVPPPVAANGKPAYDGLIHRIDVDSKQAYEATVAFTLVDVPAWADAKLQAAFPELAKNSQNMTQRVTLVQYEKDWVTPSMLSHKKAVEHVKAGKTGSGLGVEIPEGQHAALLANLTASAARDAGLAGAGLRLSVYEDSETPRELVTAKPGAVFLADKPDPNFREMEAMEWRKRELDAREKSAEALPPADRARVRSEVQKVREFDAVHAKDLQKKTDFAVVDTYLNRRQELTELLDALVEVGAYAKQPLKAGVLAGISQDGVLYTPTPGVRVSGNVVQTGDSKFTRIVKQEPMGPTLQLTVEYELTNPPKWLEALQAKRPELGLAMKGVRNISVMPSHNPDHPYTFMPH